MSKNKPSKPKDSTESNSNQGNSNQGSSSKTSTATATGIAPDGPTSTRNPGIAPDGPTSTGNPGIAAADSSSPRHPGGEAMHLYVVLSRAAQWLNAHAHHDIRKSGLNPTEFGVLEFLYHKGTHPLQQIGEKILISSGNITYVVDKLENKGLISRRASSEDRRVIYAEVTEEGRRFIESKFPQHHQALEQAVAALSPEERQQAIALLKKLGLDAQQSAKRLT